jgi:hypothetical protein
MWATIGSVGVAQAYRQLGLPYEKRWHTNTEHSEAASIPVAEDTTQSTSIMGPTTTTPQNTMTIEESTTMSEDCDTSTSQVSILPIFKKIDGNTFLNEGFNIIDICFDDFKFNIQIVRNSNNQQYYNGMRL